MTTCLTDSTVPFSTVWTCLASFREYTWPDRLDAHPAATMDTIAVKTKPKAADFNIFIAPSFLKI
jgi:hypothetical protein